MNIFKATTTIFLILVFNFSYAQEIGQELVFNGVCSMEQVGSCAMVNEPFDMKLEISIPKNTNTFTAREFWKNKSGLYEEQVNRKWTGQVLNEQALRFTLEIEPNCFGESRTETLHFIGVATCIENNCEMVLDDTFAMCPTNNCIFRIKYNLNVRSAV